MQFDSEPLAQPALGWSHAGGVPVQEPEIYPVWNSLWAMLGNVGKPPERTDVHRRELSLVAQILVHDALFEEMIAPPTR